MKNRIKLLELVLIPILAIVLHSGLKKSDASELKYMGPFMETIEAAIQDPNGLPDTVEKYCKILGLNCRDRIEDSENYAVKNYFQDCEYRKILGIKRHPEEEYHDPDFRITYRFVKDVFKDSAGDWFENTEVYKEGQELVKDTIKNTQLVIDFENLIRNQFHDYDEISKQKPTGMIRRITSKFPKPIDNDFYHSADGGRIGVGIESTFLLSERTKHDPCIGILSCGTKELSLNILKNSGDGFLYGLDAGLYDFYTESKIGISFTGVVSPNENVSFGLGYVDGVTQSYGKDRIRRSLSETYASFGYLKLF